jgi:hypothetical protein
VSPACYVIQSADWNAAVESVGHAFGFALLAVYAASRDWLSILDRIQRHRRRLRLRAIRQARAA